MLQPRCRTPRRAPAAVGTVPGLAGCFLTPGTAAFHLLAPAAPGCLLGSELRRLSAPFGSCACPVWMSLFYPVDLFVNHGNQLTVVLCLLLAIVTLFVRGLYISLLQGLVL